MIWPAIGARIEYRGVSFPVFSSSRTASWLIPISASLLCAQARGARRAGVRTRWGVDRLAGGGGKGRDQPALADGADLGVIRGNRIRRGAHLGRVGGLLCRRRSRRRRAAGAAAVASRG